MNSLRYKSSLLAASSRPFSALHTCVFISNRFVRPRCRIPPFPQRSHLRVLCCSVAVQGKAVTQLNPFTSLSVSNRHIMPPESLEGKLAAIFFDLDGTCLNSDSIHFECYRDALLELVPTFNGGVPISREFYDSEMSGRQNPELVAQILPILSLEEQTHVWQTKESRYEDVISQGVSAIAGLKPLLERCNREGIKTYIVTNAPKGTCVKTMESISITDHFGKRVVVAEECEHPKPHPAPYLRALQLAGVSASEAIAFEDSPSGTTSATAAGLLTVGMRSTQTDEALRSFGAAFTVSDYNDPKLASALSMWLK